MEFALCSARERPSVRQRKDERVDYFAQVVWELFANSNGRKKGVITNISRGGFLLKTTELIESRRWIRFVIQDFNNNLCFCGTGRVVRRREAIHLPTSDSHPFSSFGEGNPIFEHGIEFTFPNYFSLAETNLILALSKRNLRVRSCLSLNSKSSLRPGFLA